MLVAVHLLRRKLLVFDGHQRPIRAETDFNYDFGASFSPEAVANGTAVYNYGSDPGFEDREGISIFIQNEPGRVFHAYSTYARGIDPVNGT